MTGWRGADPATLVRARVGRPLSAMLAIIWFGCAWLVSPGVGEGHSKDTGGRLVIHMVGPDSLPARQAFVAIAQARPRNGSSLLCPTCYPECRLSRTTGSNGEAVFAGLDPGLLYAVVATAPGHEAIRVAGVPSDTVLTVVLSSMAPAAPGEAIIRGRTVDEDGVPLPGVRLAPFGKTIEGGLHFGSLPSTSRLALSDSGGRYAFRVGDSTAHYLVRVEHAGRGPQVARLGPAVAPPSDLVLLQAATVAGRVQLPGAAARGLRITASPCDRDASRSPGIAEVRTDESGHFVLGDLAPSTTYFIYAQPSGVPQDVLLPKLRVQTPATPAPVTVLLVPSNVGVRVRGHVRAEAGATPDSLGPVGVVSDSMPDLDEFRLPASGEFQTRPLAIEPFWLVFNRRFEIVGTSDSSASVEGSRVYFETPPRQPLEVRIRSGNTKHRGSHLEIGSPIDAVRPAHTSTRGSLKAIYR